MLCRGWALIHASITEEAAPSAAPGGLSKPKSGGRRLHFVDLKGTAAEIPDTLPDVQKRLVNYAAPGLRSLLGYET